MSIERMCKSCGGCFRQYSTLQTKCGKCIYNEYSGKKQIRKMGKVTKKWIEVRHDYIKTVKPDDDGLYTCGICGGKLSYDEITVDHKLPRGSRPDLRFEHSNLQIAHYLCNSKKGSKH
jgi:5-methylcytosine-specific restriction endonuclease McrA